MKYITCKKCKKILFISLVFLLLIFSSKYNSVVWADNLVTVIQQPTAYSDGEKAVYSIKASGSGNSYQWQYSMDNGRTWQDSGDAGNKTETQTFTVKESFKGLLLIEYCLQRCFMGRMTILRIVYECFQSCCISTMVRKWLFS